jgi:hypothetical protein
VEVPSEFALPAGDPTGAVEIDADTLLKFWLLSDAIVFEMTHFGGWVGLGVSGTYAMHSGGDGADVVVCDADGLLRYWVLEYYMPPVSEGIPVSDSGDASGECTMADGVTTLAFKRPLLAQAPTQRDVDGAGLNWLIYGYGSQMTMTFHEKYSSIQVDLSEEEVELEVEKRSATVVLWLHVVCMWVAWAWLFPAGVYCARYLRMVKQKVAGLPLWMYIHKRTMYVGWALMLLGFAFSVAYTVNSGTPHFLSFHTKLGLAVVILGFLQPFIAFVRPKPHPDQAKRCCSDQRTLWEYVHKTIGHSAVVLGIFACLSGSYKARAMGFSALFVVSLVAQLLGYMPLIFAALYKETLGGGKQDPRPLLLEDVKAAANCVQVSAADWPSSVSIAADGVPVRTEAEAKAAARKAPQLNNVAQ